MKKYKKVLGVRRVTVVEGTVVTPVKGRVLREQVVCITMSVCA